MKYLILMMIFNFSVFASEQPRYLKNGVITVTLKDNKVHSYSSNEYMVVKREPKKVKVSVVKKVNAEVVKEVQPTKTVVVSIAKKRIKHIVSGEVLRSNRGLDTSSSLNQVDVRNRKQIGVGLQYQYNVYQDLFLGGRVDTNGGAGVNLGVGF